MYSIIKDNLEIGIVDQPTYIRMQDNGAYGLCSVYEAEGIAYDGTPYHVYGMPELAGEGIESVALVEFDIGNRIFEQQQTLDALLGNEIYRTAEEDKKDEQA